MRQVPQQVTGTVVSSAGNTGSLAVTSSFLPERESTELLPSPESDELWLLVRGDLGVPCAWSPHVSTSSVEKCSDICR